MTNDELLAKADRFHFGKIDGQHDVWVVQRGDDKWAIWDGAFVFARDGEWEEEPFPSSRTDEFIERTRYGRDEAISKVYELLAGYTAGDDKEARDD